MTKKILQASRFPGGAVRLIVHLDTTKLLSDNATPDPAYVQQYDYPARDAATYATQAAYEAMVATEVKALANADPRAAAAAAKTAIAAVEGTTF